MADSITLITPTGSRQSAFELCEKYMARQTVKHTQWIVIDDSPQTPTQCHLRQTYIMGPKEWRPGINTQRLNLDAAIPLITGDYIFIIEDDDWYAPTYLEIMMKLLKIFPMVGEGNAKYYNIVTRQWRELKNMLHCSLSQTGFRRDLLPVFDEAVNSGEIYIDIVIWRKARERQIKAINCIDMNLALGMKGLPGRTGIGVGHRIENWTQDPHFRGHADPNFDQLRGWVGDDVKYYIAMANKLDMQQKAELARNAMLAAGQSR